MEGGSSGPAAKAAWGTIQRIVDDTLSLGSETIQVMCALARVIVRTLGLRQAFSRARFCSPTTSTTITTSTIPMTCLAFNIPNHLSSAR
jgi:hypothetical protein